MKTMKRRSARNTQKKVKLTVPALQKVASIMLPFYRKVAADQAYSDKWALAVRQADLDAMIALLRSVIGSQPFESLASNGIGYFVEFPVPKPVRTLTNGTSIRPGQVQFTFSSAVHRAIAKAVIPLYREIANNPRYASLIVQAINNNNEPFLNRLLRSTVTTPRFISLEIAESGMFLGFKYPASKFVYFNEIFREIVE